MTTAIYYHPEAYSTSGPKLMGRHAAGESFLRGFLRYSRGSQFWALVQKSSHAAHFGRIVAAAGRTESVLAVEPKSLGSLSKPGMVHFPGPGIGVHAFHRAAFGHGSWSLCGITHTICSQGAMDSVAQLLTAPVQSWDALICTSKAGKESVVTVLQAQAEYLSHRLGAQRVVMPQLPVIPLGIHSEDFEFTHNQREQARQAIGADTKTHVILFVGRLSFHAKAHPLAMYQALETVALQLPNDERMILVEFGVHPNEAISNAYRQAAQLACPSVTIRHLEGREEGNRDIAWASADVFCSLSDNIQETFGITPIEAMAAGLPVVVSDWDGYKDTVRDGVDGFRIPTHMPAAGFGADLALRHALETDTYDMYCGHTSSLVAVDVQAAAVAFKRLLSSPALRREMGDAARVRARQVFDWKTIIAHYEALWAQLSEVRAAQAKDLKRLAHPWPARMDPFHGFRSYPTSALTAHTVLDLVDKDSKTAVVRALAYRQLSMVDFAKLVLPSEEEIRSVLLGAKGPRTALQWVQGIAQNRRHVVFRSLTWFLKMGVLRVVS
jgi:starch synthase